MFLCLLVIAFVPAINCSCRVPSVIDRPVWASILFPFKKCQMTKILLTHTLQMRQKYYGERALAGLQAQAELKALCDGDDALSPRELVAAARDVDVIIADRLTTGPGEIFAQLPALKAFLRCAVDIRNIDVAAASAAGVLVTRASPGFVQSVVELALGYLVDLSRGISKHDSGVSRGR